MTQPDSERSSTVLVVDESDEERSLLRDSLSRLYKVYTVDTADEASTIFDGDLLPDLIIISDGLPENSSLEFCRRIKRCARTRDISVILLTDHADETSEFLALGSWTNDYITRPVDRSALLVRVDHQLRINLEAVDYRSNRMQLQQELALRSDEVDSLKHLTIFTLASIAETRDADTENHARRTRHYIAILADHLAGMPKYAEQLNLEARQILIESAPLHDIGKIGVPDSILRKSGPLTPVEFEIMKTHTTLGREAIQRAEGELGLTVPFLKVIKELAYSHHERWDGHGYPEGMSGEDIPLSARLMSVADVYDALVMGRAYKAPVPHEQVAKYIADRRSADFDPDVTDAFIKLKGSFCDISRYFVAQQYR